MPNRQDVLFRLMRTFQNHFAPLSISLHTYCISSSIYTSLVSSARKHDLDSRFYIQDILTQLLAGSTDYESMLPDIWKKSHPQANRVYRQEERRDKADRKQLKAARCTMKNITSLLSTDGFLGHLLSMGVDAFVCDIVGALRGRKFTNDGGVNLLSRKGVFGNMKNVGVDAYFSKGRK